MAVPKKCTSTLLACPCRVTARWLAFQQGSSVSSKRVLRLLLGAHAMSVVASSLVLRLSSSLAARSCGCVAKAERAYVWCGLHRCRVVVCGAGRRCPCLVGCPLVVGVCTVLVVCLASRACASLCTVLYTVSVFARAKQILVCRVAPLVERCYTCLWLLSALCWLVVNSGELLPEFFSVGSCGSKVFPEQCLGGSGGGSPRTCLRYFCSSARCSVFSDGPCCWPFRLCVLVKRFFPGVLSVHFRLPLCCPCGLKCVVWLGYVLVRFSQDGSWRFWWRFSTELPCVVLVVAALSLSVGMSCRCCRLDCLCDSLLGCCQSRCGAFDCVSGRGAGQLRWWDLVCPRGRVVFFASRALRALPDGGLDEACGVSSSSIFRGLLGLVVLYHGFWCRVAHRGDLHDEGLFPLSCLEVELVALLVRIVSLWAIGRGDLLCHLLLCWFLVAWLDDVGQRALCSV
ncbi:hypothetical protein Taro_001453 [Colocasia esculenta]|uniref:Uncharacterized protein n=1 Tax=Colocasia esculenta TaxID=4460 RepID=A0A843TG77_COLES|nr:hypothetical protein [Colocasia esculenta]